jgi:hypothetical protein
VCFKWGRLVQEARDREGCAARLVANDDDDELRRRLLQRARVQQRVARGVRA